MKTILLRPLYLVALVVAAPAFSAETPKNIAVVLQPFVDRHTLAGAVTLVATKDRVLDLEAVGFSDLAAKKLLRTDDLF